MEVGIDRVGMEMGEVEVEMCGGRWGGGGR